MTPRLYIVTITTLAFFTTATAQLVEAVGPSITDDSWSRSHARVTVTPQSTTSGLKWLDFRCDLGAFMQPAFGDMPYGYVYGTHTYGGHVRVKWIGQNPPSLSDYEAKFEVWSMRNGSAAVGLTKISPGSRTLESIAAISNYFLSSLTFNVYTSSPGAASDSGGELYGGDIYGAPLPTEESTGSWVRKDDWVTSAIFTQEADGKYYANFPVVGTTSYSGIFPGTTQNGWNWSDTATGGYRTRIAYKLVSVQNEPVN